MYARHGFISCEKPIAVITMINIKTMLETKFIFQISFNSGPFISLQLSFKCSGSPRPPPSTVDPHVDPHTGVQLQEVTATISKDLVFEYFGKSPFKCECHAWSPRGTAKSRSATVEVACKYTLYGFYQIFIGIVNNCICN